MLLRILSILVYLLAFSSVATVTVGAQESGAGGSETAAGTTLPEPLTPQVVREMVSRMSDAEVRQLLLERLDAVASAGQAAPPAGEDNPVDVASALLDGFGNRLLTALTGLPTALGRGGEAWGNFVGRLGWDGAGWLLFAILAAIGAGLAAEVLANRAATRWRNVTEETSGDETLGETLMILGSRLLRDTIGLIVFLAVTRVIGRALIPEESRPVAAMLLLSCVVLPRFVAAVLRFLLAPDRPSLRLVRTDDWSARFLYSNLVGISVLMGIGLFLINFVIANSTVPQGAGFGFWLNLAIFVWLGWTVYRARTGLTMAVEGASEEVTATEARAAHAYPWAALALLVAGWLVFELMVVAGKGALLRNGAQFLTLGILLLTPTLDAMIRGLVRHLVPPMRGQGAVAERAYASTKRSYVRIGRVLVFGLVLFIIAGIWDVNLIPSASDEAGPRLVARLLTFFMILAAGYLVWELATLLFNRRLARETTASGAAPQADDAGEGGGAGASRLSTVLPLMRMTVQGAIIVLTVLVALGNLGIDITPLVAGAGILGLAIGFGAQTLVKDIVSGVFFLIDDAFRVGEYLVIGDTVGTVEKISVRSLQLRHHEGPVHTIPYGSIGRITNNSRDWVIVKMRFTVPFDTDVNKIKKIFKKIGADILNEPYAEDIIQTFKSQGVASVDDVGLLVRGKFMAKPGKQWVIRKDIYSRVQKEFAANGIEFARREVRVTIPGLEHADLDEHQKEAIAGAAAQAALPKER